jgi:hypothetical protein
MKTAQVNRRNLKLKLKTGVKAGDTSILIEN